MLFTLVYAHFNSSNHKIKGGGVYSAPNETKGKIVGNLININCNDYIDICSDRYRG